MAMKKNKRNLRQRLAKTLVSLFVLAIFITPGLMTTKWALTVALAKDPRSVQNVPAMQVRSADKVNAPLKPLDEPLITITFDDGWESVYTKGLPLLQKHGLHSTQYIISGVFNNPLYMSEAQLKSMQKSGHQIASHTISHADLTTLDDTQLTHELTGSKKTLTDDFGGPITDFTSPYGAYNAHTLQMIGKYYRSQKNAEGDPAANELEAINVKDNFNALNIKSYSVRQTTTLADLNKLVKAAQSHNGWLVLTYHQIDNSGEPFSVTPEDFENQLILLDNANVRSATVGQVMDILAPTTKAGN
jgi:peptidoglycan/xylan/chitin deacetylase (PgdA/CDA1 family)